MYQPINENSVETVGDQQNSTHCLETHIVLDCGTPADWIHTRFLYISDTWLYPIAVFLRNLAWFSTFRIKG